MDIKKLQRVIVDGLEDVKGHNIAVFNTEHLSSLFERVIIASGTSNRQTKALAASVRDAVKTSGFPVPRTEGEENGEWIIVDCGAAVVHLMQPTIREYYHLEELWGDKPVKIALQATMTRLVKAAEPDKPVVVKKAAAKKAAAKKVPAKKATAKTAAAKSVGAKKASVKVVVAKKVLAARKAVSRKTPARFPVKPGVTRVVGVKKAAAPAAKTAAKPSAKSAPVKKVPAKNVAAKKVAAKKAPAKKTVAKAKPGV